MWQAEIVRHRARDRLIFEGARAVDLCLLKPIEQQLEIFLALAGKADDKGRAQGQIRADLAPFRNPFQRLPGIARPLHRAQNFWACVLKRNVEIRAGFFPLPSIR